MASHIPTRALHKTLTNFWDFVRQLNRAESHNIRNHDGDLSKWKLLNTSSKSAKK